MTIKLETNKKYVLVDGDVVEFKVAEHPHGGTYVDNAGREWTFEVVGTNGPRYYTDNGVCPWFPEKCVASEFVEPVPEPAPLPDFKERVEVEKFKVGVYGLVKIINVDGDEVDFRLLNPEDFFEGVEFATSYVAELEKTVEILKALIGNINKTNA